MAVRTLKVVTPPEALPGIAIVGPTAVPPNALLAAAHRTVSEALPGTLAARSWRTGRLGAVQRRWSSPYTTVLQVLRAPPGPTKGLPTPTTPSKSDASVWQHHPIPRNAVQNNVRPQVQELATGGVVRRTATHARCPSSVERESSGANARQHGSLHRREGGRATHGA